MWPFSSFSSVVRSFTLYLTLLCLSLAPSVGPSRVNAAISGVVAGATQQIPDPIPPCITSGYAEDGVLNIAPLPGHNVQFHRVNRARGSGSVGFIVTGNGVTGEREIITYDVTTMSMIARGVIQSSLLYTTGIAGEVVDNHLYLARASVTGTPGCVANACMEVTQYDRLGSVVASSQTSLRADNLDDARMSGPSTLLIGYNSGAVRNISSWNIPGTTFIATSPTTGISIPIRFAINGDMGQQYAAAVNALAVRRYGLGQTTHQGTGTFLFSGLGTFQGLGIIPSAGMVVGGSSSIGGIGATRSYMTNNLTLIGVSAPFLVADGNEGPFTMFYDSVNNKIHSFRTDAGIGAPSLIRTDPLSIIEQRFTCANCNASPSIPQNDFIESKARLYVSNAVAGRFAVRIKVCATGGPPA